MPAIDNPKHQRQKIVEADLGDGVERRVTGVTGAKAAELASARILAARAASAAITRAMSAAPAPSRRLRSMTFIATAALEGSSFKPSRVRSMASRRLVISDEILELIRLSFPVLRRGGSMRRRPEAEAVAQLHNSYHLAITPSTHASASNKPIDSDLIPLDLSLKWEGNRVEISRRGPGDLHATMTPLILSVITIAINTAVLIPLSFTRMR